ncbi:MAG TPA: cysteine--tRNA ligase, partial [Actinomycetota bacterium]
AVVNELVSSPEVADAEKRALLRSWDQVLGLDLEREAREAWQPTEEMLARMAERDHARSTKDYETSDRIRDDLAAMGLEVMDTPDGTKVRPRD